MSLKIDNTIKSFTCKALTEKGFVGAHRDTLEIAEQAQLKLNQDILSFFGVTVSNLNLTLEEDTEYSTRYSDLECN